MNPDTVNVRTAGAHDVADIVRIYNHGITSRQGTFDTTLREAADVEGWLTQASRYPVLVAEAEGQVVGFARLFEYRPRACYAGIAEFSIYLDPLVQGKGVGSLLLSALLAAARDAGFHKVLSRIFTFNQASRALCRKLGFREVGVYERHGQLDGRWLDVVVVEYLTDAQQD
ncbi:arsinothricin resistance N-acetyltransferase ArsN1 [Aestuariibacter halophilus]|uniref:Arsinothricin resistance N-acetyltransferase ArsN1 n=1 Tax=Fluctibacter halophilus TaxID=226011 RepID=A0ABS8G2K2_9ALTE|nr:arsinothricin resistance N-acetyltransferase ArsN1 family A [Aestuariibacter halophilus]MCC2614758.1 arsinothricin resistance N-acetyltransferase ArsN1 [Aestuariibacter halophilus]